MPIEGKGSGACLNHVSNRKLGRGTSLVQHSRSNTEDEWIKDSTYRLKYARQNQFRLEHVIQAIVSSAWPFETRPALSGTLDTSRSCRVAERQLV